MLSHNAASTAGRGGTNERLGETNRPNVQRSAGAPSTPFRRAAGGGPGTAAVGAPSAPDFAERLLALQTRLLEHRSSDPGLAASALEAAESVLSGDLINPVQGAPATGAPAPAAASRLITFPVEAERAEAAPLLLSLLPDAVLTRWICIR